MQKMPKVIALAVGVATLLTLGQAPAQADTQSVGQGHSAQYDTGWD